MRSIVTNHKCTIILLLLTMLQSTHAQDSLKTLSSTQLLSLVRNYHPIALQAEIGLQKAKAQVLITKGEFDPVLKTYAGSKTFDGTHYYSYSSPELSIPTWFGIEVYTGLENLSGSRLDQAQTPGETGYLGVNIPLARDLLLDKRRAALKQAKLIRTMAKAQQKAILNTLLYDAIECYWNWVKAYQTYVVVSQNVEVNKKRLDLVKKAFQFGERPAIDTLEALAQLQSFQFDQNQYQLEFQNAGLILSVYLWDANGNPYNLPQDIKPGDWENELLILQTQPSLNDLLDKAQQEHPELAMYDSKMDILIIDRKLKFQQLLPKAEFSYQTLSKGYSNLNVPGALPLFENNYRYGFNFEIPLRLSNGRGEYQLSKLKLTETQLDLSHKRLSIQLKVKAYYNEYITLKNQIELQTNNYNNYKTLQKAEEIRFFNGESSMFLVNSRENKTLETFKKLIELKTKFAKTAYALQYSAGSLE